MSWGSPRWFQKTWDCVGRHATPSVHCAESGSDVVVETRPVYVQSSFRVQDADTAWPGRPAPGSTISATSVWRTCSAGCAQVPSCHVSVPAGAGFVTLYCMS